MAHERRVGRRPSPRCRDAGGSAAGPAAPVRVPARVQGRGGATARNLIVPARDTGPDVLAVQRRLASLGYAPAPPDGIYGATTMYAVTVAFDRVGVSSTRTARAENGAGRVPARRITLVSAQAPPAPDDACWKLAEYERHFNTIQAGIRALASVWLLAAFGAIATLLKREETDKLWVSPEWVIGSICAMGAGGLALLWIIDQLVYHRLLNAAFIVGLKLEQDDSRRPPMHASMYASAPPLGFAQLLSLFYLLPIAALGAIAVAAAIYAVSGDPKGWDWALFALAAVPAVLAVAIFSQGGRERAFFRKQAGYFGDSEFQALFGATRGAGTFHKLLARYGRRSTP